jgi:hypothetical protein
VDEFDQDHNACKTDDGFEVNLRLFASKCHPFEAFQFADRLLDAGRVLYSNFGKNLGLFRAFERYGMTGAMPRLRQASRFAFES